METRYKLIEYYTVDGEKKSVILAIKDSFDEIVAKFNKRIEENPYAMLKVIQEVQKVIMMHEPTQSKAK